MTYYWIRDSKGKPVADYPSLVAAYVADAIIALRPNLKAVPATAEDLVAAGLG